MKTSATLIIVFFAREQKWKRNKGKKLMYIYLPQDALVIFWRSVFCNTTSTTSSIAPLQQCLLQHHFNIISVALSFAVTHSQVPSRPQVGLTHSSCGIFWTRGTLPASSTKGGERGVLKAPGQTRKRYKLTQLHDPASKSNPQMGQNSFCTFLVLGQATG